MTKDSVQPQLLPADLDAALLVGRAWQSRHAGPSIVVVRDGEVHDITHLAPTMADLLDRPELAAFLRTCRGTPLGSAAEWMQRSLDDEAGDRLLAPCDLQPVKACGVTFAVSLLERVIEEQAGGDPRRAASVRAELERTIGADLRAVQPGSQHAMQLKKELQSRGTWSQYLEVGIGPDAEVFTKSPPMSAVGVGARIGLLRSSEWNNPEPEIVLAVNARLEIVGATLGNDVNLRDIEGRSALLLGKAKDNNASCAVGPFIRVLDERFTLDSVRACRVSLRVEGRDGFLLEATSDMREISRDPADLVRQAAGSHHQYPDGFMLFLGTMFSPTKDRAGPGSGFTHKVGDRVTVAAPELGALVNDVDHCDAIPPWTFGARALYRSLAERGLDRTGLPSTYPGLAGRRVLITGGGMGIGAAMVEAFARHGAKVVFLDIAEAPSRELEARLAPAARPPRFLRCDLTDIAALESAIARVEAELGGVDVLLNNAANDDRHALEDVTPAYWDGRLAVNLRHQFFCARAVARGMRKRRSGAIVNVGSISWHRAMTELSVYMVAKAGIEAMTRGLARELGGDGIRVNCIVPGAVRTPRQTQLWRSPQIDAQILAAQCLQREIEPEHVAAMALFLASDAAAGCSGREYFVDGGMYGA